MKTVPLRYVHEFRDRHGRLRRYFRRRGFKQTALPGVPISPEFMLAYQLALSGHLQDPIGLSRSPPGTLAAAIAEYYRDHSFLGLAPGTRKMRRAILEHFRAEHGDKRIAQLRSVHVAKLLGTKRPFAAHNWLKTLRGLMQFAVATGLVPHDPTAGIRPTRARSQGVHSWTEAEIEQYEARHPIGTRARLAMALMLYTAARRGDAVRLGPQHLRNGHLSYRQQKTGRLLVIPVHPDLAAIIGASSGGHLTFLTTQAGSGFSAAGFGNLFRDWCNQAGLAACSAHGLRKAQARRLAEAGCSAHEIAAITGHKTLAEVQRYADAADQARMAEAAILRTQSGKPKLVGGKPGE